MPLRIEKETRLLQWQYTISVIRKTDRGYFGENVSSTIIKLFVDTWCVKTDKLFVETRDILLKIKLSLPVIIKTLPNLWWTGFGLPRYTITDAPSSTSSYSSRHVESADHLKFRPKKCCNDGTHKYLRKYLHYEETSLFLSPLDLAPVGVTRIRSPSDWREGVGLNFSSLLSVCLCDSVCQPLSRDYHGECFITFVQRFSPHNKYIHLMKWDEDILSECAKKQTIHTEIDWSIPVDYMQESVAFKS